MPISLDLLHGRATMNSSSDSHFHQTQSRCSHWPIRDADDQQNGNDANDDYGRQIEMAATCVPSASVTSVPCAADSCAGM